MPSMRSWSFFSSSFKNLGAIKSDSFWMELQESTSSQVKAARMEIAARAWTNCLIASPVEADVPESHFCNMGSIMGRTLV
eukprot:CAMPEP_0201647868 /NCGR_PEP_ID=MMETSP0493-20130528/36580_1 /ASSEMBLY_ACC=CAM_ASM_000838 /TAXON_ID=420259 /ORGANISM="Thalassiosira gravida, Strain GMp14c1" /LENGTH=79 /DNA_ID=CAMNT_0048123373 /DNA_START=63 /DNA_END=299 /DNA_ORIENTATION=+